MATQAQVDANQANARKSTGPKTEEGKARSSRNRLSHGFASSTRFVHGEDPAEFNLLLDDLISEHQPATPTEQIQRQKTQIGFESKKAKLLVKRHRKRRNPTSHRKLPGS